jgi:hypothetical protein
VLRYLQRGESEAIGMCRGVFAGGVHGRRASVDPVR